MTQTTTHAESPPDSLMARTQDLWQPQTGPRGSLLSRCGAWWRVRSPARQRGCVWEVWHALTPCCACVGCCWPRCCTPWPTGLHSFVCRIFMPQYHYPFAVPLSFIQMLLSLLALRVLHAVGVLQLKPLSLRLAERLLVPAVCGSGQTVLALWAEAGAHSGLYPLTGRLLPVLSLAWGRALALSAPGSVHLTCLLAGLTVASISVTVCQGLHMVEPLECLYSALSPLLHSLSLAWLAKVAQSEPSGSSPWDLYYTLTVTRSLLLGALCLLHPDAPRALAEGNWHTLLFLGYMLGMLLLGALQRLLVDVTALCFSAPSAALLHSARGLLLPLYRLR